MEGNNPRSVEPLPELMAKRLSQENSGCFLTEIMDNKSFAEQRKVFEQIAQVAAEKHLPKLDFDISSNGIAAMDKDGKLLYYKTPSGAQGCT